MPDTLQSDTTLLQKLDTIFRQAVTSPPRRIRDTLILGTNSTNVFYFTDNIDSLKLLKLNTIDSSTLYFHEFDPLWKYNGIYSTLSNIGMAHKNLVFNREQTIGYYIAHQSFPRYIYHSNRVRYYKQYIPYTELEYILGAKREQNFSIIFSREFLKRFSFGFDFALNFSPGPYTNNKIDDKRLFFTFQYYTRNARYGVIANYLWNKINVGENGGISNDSIFENDVETDRRIIPVYLDRANNEVRHSGFFVEQYFNLLKPAADTSSRKIDAGSLAWSVEYDRNQMRFLDNDPVSDFYVNHMAPLDSAGTFDSVYQERLRNRVRWSSIGYHDDARHQVFHVYFGIIHDIIRQESRNYYDSLAFLNQMDKQFNQLSAFGSMGVYAFKVLKINASFEYVLSENNKNDLKVSGTLEQILGTAKRNFGRINAGIDLITRSPSWYFQEFHSNYYRWSNELKKENYFVLFGEYTFRRASAGVKFTTLGNYTYFDAEVRPRQMEEPATILQIYGKGTIRIKKFGINARLVYQTTSADAIRLPAFSGTLNLFFKTPIFRRAATIQTGFQFFYFSSYYADAYMPALRDFYLQNEKKIGDHPYADVYITLQLKRARLFLKYAHFNSMFSKSNYYLAPHYPGRDARFAFGINWRFHD